MWTSLHADDEIKFGELDDNESEPHTASIIEDHVDCDNCLDSIIQRDR